jgi:hypothetical protein
MIVDLLKDNQQAVFTAEIVESYDLPQALRQAFRDAMP